MRKKNTRILNNTGIMNTQNGKKGGGEGIPRLLRALVGRGKQRGGEGAQRKKEKYIKIYLTISHTAAALKAAWRKSPGNHGVTMLW